MYTAHCLVRGSCRLLDSIDKHREDRMDGALDIDYRFRHTVYGLCQW